MNVAIVDNVRQYLGLPPSPLSPRYHRWPRGTHWTLLVVRPGAYLDSLEDTNTVTQLPQTGHEIVPTSPHHTIIMAKDRKELLTLTEFMMLTI